MIFSRRGFAALLPAIAVSQSGSKPDVLGTKPYRFEDLSVRESGPIRIYQVFTGTTHAGFLLDLHESELAASQAPHEPHRHAHEEMILIREGTLEFNVSGRKTLLGPGSIAYVASNESHGFRNPGNTPAKYFVLSLDQD